MKTYLHILNHSVRPNGDFFENFFVQNGSYDIAHVIIQHAERWGVDPKNIRCFVYTKKLWEEMLKQTSAQKPYSVKMGAYIIPDKPVNPARLNTQIFVTES